MKACLLFVWSVTCVCIYGERISVDLELSTPLETHATFDLGIGELFLSLRGSKRGVPVVLAALRFAGGAAGHLAPDSLYRFVLSAGGISLLTNSVVGPPLRPDTRMPNVDGLSSSGSIPYPAGRFGWIDHVGSTGRNIGVWGSHGVETIDLSWIVLRSVGVTSHPDRWVLRREPPVVGRLHHAVVSARYRSTSLDAAAVLGASSGDSAKPGVVVAGAVRFDVGAVRSSFEFLGRSTAYVLPGGSAPSSLVVARTGLRYASPPGEVEIRHELEIAEPPPAPGWYLPSHEVVSAEIELHSARASVLFTLGSKTVVESDAGGQSDLSAALDLDLTAGIIQIEGGLRGAIQLSEEQSPISSMARIGAVIGGKPLSLGIDLSHDESGLRSRTSFEFRTNGYVIGVVLGAELEESKLILESAVIRWSTTR